jgi:hypothetical protein
MTTGTAGTSTGSGSGTSGTGTSSTSTGGVIMTGGRDAASGAGGGLLGDAACVSTAIRGDQRPVTLYFMMDNSQSMTTIDPGQTLSRWQIISDAVPAFAADPANAGLFAGLDFFPEPAPGGGGGRGGTALCAPTDYENPNVPIDVLPGASNAQAMAFATAISGRTLGGGGTPTTPALQGALAFSAMWQTAHPERTVSVVFVTDGIPNGCSSTVANAAMAAAAGLAGTPSTPSIKTYVLGVGPEVVANLDPVAMAGGTGTAYVVTMGGAAALSAALAAIKGTTVTCDYNIPTPSGGGTIDFGLVNVQTTIGPTGAPTLIGRVDNAGACGTGPGWYFDHPVPGVPPPTKITLCPGSCGPVQTTPGSQLDVLLGCKTEPRVQ